MRPKKTSAPSGLPAPTGHVLHRDAVVHGRRVAQVGVPVRLADGHVVHDVVVPAVDRRDLLRGQAVDRRDHRGVDEPAPGQRQEVEVVVQQVEVRSPLEGCGDVQALGDLDVVAVVLLVRRSTTEESRAAVRESPEANSVTSTPRATSPSVSRETTSSHGP
jgi:hypothetical protein